ncbi:MAG: NAD(P)H-hydrate epimerase [Methanobacteriota archaeon]|nr:MAG: NAD(P)H-hydrate epimerase [Euryarchaeota archaeon]
MSPTVSEPARWELRWPEVAVLDGNAAALGIEEASLMDSAGKSLAATALEMTDGAVLVLCGPGNNGGDGFVAARYLREWGVEVSVLASHASARTDVCVWPERPSGEWALVVDCLLGAGASGPGYSLRGQIKDIAAWAAGLGLPVLACDIPTGLGGPDALQADATITFHSMKQGLGSPDSGDITVVPLPWPAEVEDCGPGDATRYPTLDASARKGDRGRLWVIGGGPYHGAPLLAGMAAARSGCDLVHVAMPSVAAGRAEWPTTLIPEELPDEDKLTGSSLEHIAIAFEARPPQALVIGPGLGRDEATMQAVSASSIRPRRRASQRSSTLTRSTPCPRARGLRVCRALRPRMPRRPSAGWLEHRLQKRWLTARASRRPSWSLGRRIHSPDQREGSAAPPEGIRAWRWAVPAISWLER